MNAVIVHYHLKPGGVTTVIRRQLEACVRLGVRAFLAIGEEPPDPPGVPYAVLPDLAYDPPGPGLPGDRALERGKALARALDTAARNWAGGPPDLYHVHNPAIRKNSALCPALSELAAGGARVLIQAHDFAEDWRPDVLIAGPPYPAGCRWAVLNGRDLRALLSAGLGDSDVELLPNSLPSVGRGEAAPRAGSADLALYPVRGIRRKNLGELLLLARWLPRGLSAAVTLPPNNPRDFPLYEAWKTLAREMDMPLAFEAGLTSSLDSLYARAKTVVTTSVKEGFGFSFLEPMARGVPVAGRRLESALPDLEAAGLAYPGLYRAIRVSRDLFDEAGFARRLDVLLESVSGAFAAALGRRPAWLEGRMAEVRAGALPDTGTDYAVLDETAQVQILERLRHDPEAAGEVEAANPFLSSWWDVSPPDRSALSAYSPESGAERLRLAYERTISRPGGPAPDRDALARALLTVEGFFCPGL